MSGSSPPTRPNPVTAEPPVLGVRRINMRSSPVTGKFSTILAAASIFGAAVFSGPGLHAARPTLFDQLVNVNRNWAYVGPEKKEPLLHPVSLDESELLKKHLELVEHWLRTEPPIGLSAEQRRARAENLQYLHEYWTREMSPRNHILPHRNPVFIDGGGRVCAVGYLMFRSGREDLARALSRLDNRIYIREIRDPRFDAWVQASGLTVDELAWIQPAYGPEDVQEWEPVGRSLQGEVRSVVVDEKTGRIYAGGSFQIRGSKAGPVNLAVFDGKVWRDVGNGVRGTVDALLLHKDRLYVGGSFDKAGAQSSPFLAVWDLSKKNWITQKDKFDGRVRTFAVYKDSVFAGGDFTRFGGNVAKHFVRWDGEKKTWQSAGSFDASIFAMTVFADKLIATGTFRNADGKPAQYAASFDGKDWSALAGGLPRPAANLAAFDGRLVFGIFVPRNEEQRAGGDEEKRCSFILPAWTGQEWQDVPFESGMDCDASLPGVGGLTVAGDALVIGIRDTGTLRFLVRDSAQAGAYQGWMVDSLTGLSKLFTLASWKGQLLIGGVHDKVRKNYVSGSEIISGKNVMRYFKYRSAFNRIDYSQINADTFYTPFRALNGIQEEE